jgi:heme-degrading monooxygenase HmoA
MHARVAAFENVDTSVVDDLLARVRQNIEANRVPDAQGGLMLLDRDERKSLGITFFESEEKIRAAEPEFERMGDEIPEEQRGRRTSVDTYELVIAEGGGEGARAARMSVLEGSPERLDEGTRYAQEEILPQLRQLGGFKGIVSLIDRERGRAKLISLWESDDALRASEQQATELRQQAAEGAASRVVGVERYEVALAELGQVAVMSRR